MATPEADRYGFPLPESRWVPLGAGAPMMRPVYGMCRACGALVADEPLHDAWHETIERMTP